MAKLSGEKLKLLYILKLLYEETDENHRISVKNIIEYLKEKGISAERKSIYRDLGTLEEFGIDILHSRQGVCIASRTFEDAEVRLLADAVSASRFITEKKSAELIAKLSSLSGYGSKQLQRSVYIAERTRSDNETIYYTVNAVHEAIASNRMISFYYFDWTPQKTKQLRRGGALYAVSPIALLWEDERYYLIAFDDRKNTVKHFRVDKMLQTEVSPSPRRGKDIFSHIDIGSYSDKIFGMFGGEECTVTLRCENSLAGVIFDRFGTDVPVYPEAGGTFSVSVRVMLSNNFYSWIMQFAGRIRILSPADARDGMKRLINECGEAYK